MISCTVALLLLGAPPARAEPPVTRPAAEGELPRLVGELDWPEAELALRLAVAEAMREVEAPRPADDWSAGLGALVASRQAGPWQRAWQLRLMEAALLAGDVPAATKALERAEEAAGAPLPEERRRVNQARLAVLAKQILPWLLAAAGAVGTGTLVDTLASRRRQDPKAPIILNPYVTGRPLRDGKLVFGRDPVLSTLTRGLRAGRSYYLTGERRIGKTTLLLQIGELNRMAGGLSVFVDVAGSSGRQALAVLDRALRSQARAARVPERGSLREVAERLAARGPLRLLVDEVDALNQADAATRRAFRELALGEGAPATLIAAGVGLDLTRDEEARAWARALEVIDVEPLGEEAARALLTEPVATQMSWAPAALDAVLRASTGRPMLLQLWALNVVDHVGSQERSRATPDDVEAVRTAVEKAWKSILDHGLEDEHIPVDIDMAHLELGRLRQEIDELERELRVRR